MAAEDLDQESWAVDLTALTWKKKKVMTTFPLLTSICNTNLAFAMSYTANSQKNFTTHKETFRTRKIGGISLHEPCSQIWGDSKRWTLDLSSYPA